jgi:hypothetical protein
MEVLEMEDIHRIFGEFKKAYPDVYNAHESLGKEIHENIRPSSGQNKVVTQDRHLSSKQPQNCSGNPYFKSKGSGID